MAAMRSRPMMTMSADAFLRNIDVLLTTIALGATGDQESEHAGEEEKDAVHDAKDPAGLEHGARLVDVEPHATQGDGAQHAEADDRVRVGCDATAVVVPDAAQLVDAGDQGADEAEVDEGDEECVGARAVVGEECVDGPRAG